MEVRVGSAGTLGQPPGKAYPPPQCHPESGEGESARVIAGAWGPPMAWSLQRLLGFPQAEKRSVRSQLWVSGPKLQTLSQSAACSKASSAGTSPLPPLQGKTPEPAGRICATKLLPQGHYVSPVYLPLSTTSQLASRRTATQPTWTPVQCP